MSGKVQEATTITNEIERRQRLGKAWEGYLLEEIHKHDLLSKNRYDWLHALYGMRNRSAHPTGNLGSKRDAEYVFSNAVDNFLQPGLAPPELAVPQLLESLSNDHFFSELTLGGVIETVTNELRILDGEVATWSRLITNLVEAAEKTADGDEAKALNARNFLCGLAAGENVEIRDLVFKKAIGRYKVFDKQRHGYLLPLLASQPRMMRMPEDEIRKRLDVLLEALVEGTPEDMPIGESQHPIWLLRRMVTEFSDELDPTSFAGYPRTVKFILQKYWSEPEILRVLRSGLHEYMVDSLMVRINLQDPRDEPEIVRLLTEGDRLISGHVMRGDEAALIIQTLKASNFQGPVRQLCESGFQTTPMLASLAHNHEDALYQPRPASDRPSRGLRAARSQPGGRRFA
jgi:hypothetical protein